MAITISFFSNTKSFFKTCKQDLRCKSKKIGVVLGKQHLKEKLSLKTTQPFFNDNIKLKVFLYKRHRNKGVKLC